MSPAPAEFTLLLGLLGLTVGRFFNVRIDWPPPKPVNC